MIRTAARLGDTHRDRTVRIGPIEGILRGLLPVGDRVTLILEVADLRVEVGPVHGSTPVEVSRK